ncbi:DUF4238 domain-containing protein [Allomuricauda sp. d1]|uniref:DUF4238 domain-containing protein n=1 Tax=Allomuricauda sp. d1 TaxID=3136725 RepID=UPI0031CFE205
MSISRRHHYIPKFLIQGFAGDDGKLAVFDRQKNLLNPSRKYPKQVFYEWNRNLFFVNGKETDFIEELFSKIESRFAPAYHRIISKEKNPENPYFDHFHLIHYLGILFNSLPLNDEKITELVQKSTFEDFAFQIRNKDGSEIPEHKKKEILKRFRQEPAFTQAIKSWKGITDYLKLDIVKFSQFCKVYHAASEVQLHLLGDNPFLLKNERVSAVYESEFIFPLSKGVTFYHYFGKELKSISAENRIKVDILIFLQSNKLVCSPDSSYLSMIANIASKYDSKEKIIKLKELIFRIFENN